MRFSKASTIILLSLGVCFGCVVPTKNGYVRLCVDGPVLHADTLEHV